MFRIRSDPRLSESNAIPSPGFHRIRRIPVGSDKILYWIRWGPSMGLFDLGISGSKIICPAIGGIHPRHISVAKLFGVKDGSRSSKSSSASSKASNDRAKPRPCLIWKTHPLVQVLVMARFGGMDQVPAGSLPPDSGRNCTGNIRSAPDRFQLEVCRERPGNDWNLRLNFRPESGGKEMMINLLWVHLYHVREQLGGTKTIQIKIFSFKNGSTMVTAPDANSIHRDIISSDDSENDILLNNESLLSSIFGTE
ncbi:unnamed protein product [Adineta ricciae]|uniref:Uncharacterized protein n=1 Tax=Adineta ricciae TaxID=249248 RepID=A0A813PX33_ADIRI|nr:unnamed protein product [Adineta ricciae]